MLRSMALGAQHDSKSHRWLYESSGITSGMNVILESESKFDYSGKF